MFQLLNKKSAYYFLPAVFIFFFILNEDAQEPAVRDSVKIIHSVSDSFGGKEQKPVYNPELVSHYRPVPVDTINAINRDSRFYYKKYLDSLLRTSKRTVNTKQESNGFLKNLYELLIWIGAITIVGFLLYRLFFSEGSLFARKSAVKNKKTKRDESEMPADLNDQIQNAILSGDYRQAIRYYYLNTLNDLAAKGFIEIAAAKTNFQYVSEVSRRPFANDFASLTLKYEYVWYGQYPLDENLFKRIQSDFSAFNKTLGK